ncbi:50S ribosomal protein L7ae [Lewinella cohaerens]|uniref:50S ribosomal protein L7ae n=1 Tax=Lewinella cohaerens TaxID=70995 RepID=UPI00035EB256|nr:50S ribosomal protein L7ae [Lewinella cohaerens]
MILKAEPRTIMRFIEDNFESLSQLYRIQLKKNLIPTESFEEVTRHKGDIVTRRLSAFKILRPVGDDYRLAEEVGAYLGFLMQEFKPLLPEQLRRYHTSIQDVYELLTIRPDLEDKTRSLRLEHLYNEVQSFLDNVTNNTYTLLKRSQRLKVNRQQMTYSERVKEARLLIEQYIDPLNQIVNLNDANSIASLLQNIGRDINLDRMANYPPSVIERYEQLDNLLRQVNTRLQRESDVIRRELTPLIERIKRESEVLGGWLVFLERPLLLSVPDFAKRNPQNIFGDQTAADLKIYMEQFQQQRQAARIKLSDGPVVQETPLLDRQLYRKRMKAALPISDFFTWCLKAIADHPAERQESDLFELTSLLFSSEEQYELVFSGQRQRVRLNEQYYTLPLFQVTIKPEEQ